MPKKKGLQLRPHSICAHWWWYEEPQGLTVIHAHSLPSKACSRCSEHGVEIRWSSIEAALSRM